MNYCCIRENKAQFWAGHDYVKPDLICGTESWLKGIRPGKEPSKNAKNPVKYFQTITYFIRISRAGGVFTRVKDNLVATEQT